MRRMTKTLNIVRVRFLEDFPRPRTILVFSMMLLYVAATIIPVREYGLWAKCGVAPGVFACMVDEQLCQMVFAGGAVVLFSGAPFKNGMDTYMLPRAGRLSTALGNCAYLLILSVLYVSALFGFVLIGLAGALDMGSGWGKLLRSMGNGILPDGFSSRFSAVPAMLYQFDAGYALANALVLEVLCVAFIGLSVYVGNRAFQRPVGLWLGGGLVMLDLTIYNMLPEQFYTISPVSLPRLTLYAGNYRMPWNNTFAYGYLFLISGVILMIAIALLEEKYLSDGRRRLFSRKEGKRI